MLFISKKVSELVFNSNTKVFCHDHFFITTKSSKLHMKILFEEAQVIYICPRMEERAP